MEKVERYRELIKQQIRRYVESFSDANSDVQEVEVFDDERGHYQWVSLGWENGKRAFYTHLYVRLRDGRFGLRRIQPKTA